MSQRNGVILVILAILSFFILVLTVSASETAKFTKIVYEKSMPENDLWKYDCLNCKSTTGLDEEMFNKIIDVAYEQYRPLADANNEQLVINKNWTDATVNADCSRNWGTVEVNMYGGLARREEITAEGFALVLCHELSHAYGGIPYIRVSSKMSAEGQSDYMSTRECAKKVFKELGEDLRGTPTSFMTKACKKNAICLSSLIGGQSLGNLLATIKSESIPNFETPDPLVVTKTNLSYPATVQCRLDTYLNGALGKDRPLCWYKP